MNADYTLPFGIDFVVQEDLATQGNFRIWKATGNSYDITCPFCGAKRKMNINTEKNVAKCNKCGCGSGYNTITLHAALTGLSNKESFKDLMRRWDGLESDIRVSYKKAEEKRVTDENTPADILIRDLVYRTLLSKLTLSQKHHDDLIKRGLTEEQIKAGLYKTVPVIGLHTLAYECVYETGIISAMRQHKNWGIPGFTDVHNEKSISLRKRKNGYFVPVIQKDGMISGMQIRYDNLPENASEVERETFKKYSWYSSSEKATGCGVTGCENIHFAGDWTKVPESVNLTEGVLKADIASALSGKQFLGLVGVNNTRQLRILLPWLQEKGVKNVKLYVDMDYREKKEVAAALLGIRREINRAGNHTYSIVKSSREDIRIAPYGLEYDSELISKKGVRISFKEKLPEKIWVFIGSEKVPAEKYVVKKNSINFDFEYMTMLRNSDFVIRIVNATSFAMDEYDYLTPAQKKVLIKSNLFAGAVVRKTGMTYTAITWDENYKGIDDYYLYRKSLLCEDN